MINGMRAHSLAQQPQAWDGHAYKDRNEDKPLSIHRSYVRPGRNLLVLTSYDPQPHVAVLLLSEPRTWSELVEAVTREQTLPLARATAHMKATFGDDDDDDLVAGPARLSLCCPLSHTRIKTPARAEGCRHLECFDLASYLECAHSTSHPRWTCPLCAKPARPHQLRVDSWTTTVLEASPASRSEVSVQPDGTFGPVPERPAGGSSTGGGSQRKRKASSLGGGSSSGGGSGGGSGGSGPASASAAFVLDAASAAALLQDGAGSAAAIDRVVDELLGGDGGGTSSDGTAGGSLHEQPVLDLVEQGDDEEHPIELSDDDD
jgi:uncharacterized membrane protein YgcG